MKVLIADNHFIVRVGLLDVLTKFSSGAIVLEAEDVEQTRTLAQTNSDVDLLLLDLTLPGLEDITALTTLKSLLPQTPIVVFSAIENTNIIKRALEHGAHGFIPKSCSRETFVSALTQIMSGQTYSPDGVQQQAWRTTQATQSYNLRTPESRDFCTGKPTLTKRQRDVLLLLYKGMPTNEIAQALSLSPATVKSHISSLYRILGVSNRTQAGVAARRYGLIRKKSDEIA